jgi:hypothetical protein
MKFVLLLLLLPLLAGCASDPDDRAFFNRGWINPKELDQPPKASKPSKSDKQDKWSPEVSPWNANSKDNPN